MPVARDCAEELFATAEFSNLNIHCPLLCGGIVRDSRVLKPECLLPAIAGRNCSRQQSLMREVLGLAAVYVPA